MKVTISKRSLQGTTVTKPLHTLQRVSFAPTNVHANDNLGRTGGCSHQRKHTHPMHYGG
jgi:hypothetical protein